MRSISRWTSLAGLVAGVALIAVACSSAAATPTAAKATPTSTAVGTPVATPTTAASVAPAAFTIATTTDSTIGAFLTGQNGMTLYVLTLDSADTSTCAGTCATHWPPLTVAGGTTITGPSSAAGAFATITRADGRVQVTFNHMPLYYFSGDSVAGDTNGQGADNTWYVAPLGGTVPAY